MKKLMIALATLAATAGAAQAHVGDHALSIMQSLFHLLTEPDHLAMMIGAVVISVLLFLKFRKRA
jgi:hydrogenase/urease accessory protein HupE